MNYSKVILREERIYVHPIGDLHIGHKSCNIKMIEEYLSSIPKKQNHRIILMGDLMDCGTKDAVGASVYEQSLSPQEQLEKLAEMLRPFASQIDMVLMGNHEYRITKATSIDVMKTLTDILNIPYHLYTGIVTYTIGANTHKARSFNIAATHGSGGGALESSLRKCKRMSEKVVADIYLMGHCHHKAHTTRLIKTIDARNERINETKQHFVLTGSALQYDDTYADQALLEISDPGFVGLELVAAGIKGKEVRYIEY